MQNNGFSTGVDAPAFGDNRVQIPSILGPDGKAFRSGFALPPVLTFSGIVNAVTKSFSSRWDEALRNSRDDARAMYRDAAIWAMLQERWAPTVTLSWQLEPEDNKSNVQKAVVDEMTKIINRIPHKIKLKQSLIKCGWYGHAGANLCWGRKPVSGEDKQLIVNHVPINGDKIIYRFDGDPCILVHSGYVVELEKRHAEIVRTDRGNALSLRDPYWRQQVAIAVYEQDDADFMEPEARRGRDRGPGHSRTHLLVLVDAYRVHAVVFRILRTSGAGGLRLLF